MKKCEICNIICDNHAIYANHMRWKHKKIEYKRINCIYCNYNVRQENYKKHLSVCNKNPINLKKCKECGEIISSYVKKFCNSSCSAKYNNTVRKVNHSYITPEWREKLRKISLDNWKNGIFTTNNRKKFFTSKNEREIFNHFKFNYPNDNWKSGGRLVLSDGSFLSRDMWSDKLKTCFEYDGIWHFKDIHGQLEKKQKKDKLLEEWCLKNNYRLIRIDEQNYLNLKQIEKLIYKRKKQIIKIGSRY